MDLTNRVDHVDEELKLLKNEIKQVLLEIQEQVLSVQNPFSGIVVAADDDRSRATSAEAAATSNSGEPDPPAPAAVPPPPPPAAPPPVVPKPEAQPPVPQPMPGPGLLPQPMVAPGPMPQPMPMPQGAPPQPAMPIPPQPAPTANPIAVSAPPVQPPIDVVALRRDIEGAMEPKVEAWVRDFAKREFERLKAELELGERPPSEPRSPEPRATKKDAASVLELGEIDGSDLDLDAVPELPLRRFDKKTVSADSKPRPEPEDEPEELDGYFEDLDDEGEVERRRTAPRQKAKRPLEEPATDIPRKTVPVDSEVVDLVTLGELAEWVGHVLANSGREYVETLLDLAVKTGRLSAGVDGILRGLIRLLSDQDSSVRVSAKEMILQLAQLDTLVGVHDSTITRLLPLLLRGDLEDMPSARL